MLLFVAMALCGRVWEWRDSVPAWCWVAIAVSGWTCFRTTLRACGASDNASQDAAAGATPWSPPAWAWSMACGAAAYAANLAHAPSASTVGACLLLALLLRARLGLAVLAMVAASVNLVVLVLVRADAHNAAYTLAAMGLAWVCGLLVAGGAWTLLRRAPVRIAPGPRWRPLAAPGVLQKWHGRLLVTTAACVPVGEGLALVMLGLLGIMISARRRHVPWAYLREHQVLRGMAGAFACWAVAGAWALVMGGEGWLKPSELGRWMPYLALALPVCSVGAVPRRYFSAAATAFVASLMLACVVGLIMHGFDLRPGSGALSFLRVPSDQAWVPNTWRTVAGGFYFHRLKMAHVLLVGIACLAVRQVCLPLPLRRRLLESAALSLLGVTLFYTFARGAWLGLAAVVGVCVLLSSWRWRAALVMLALGTSMALMALPAQRARLYSMADPAASAIRATVWQQAVTVLHEHPWGVGLGNYTPVIGRYYDRIEQGQGLPRTYPHNMVLGAWAETGPVGLTGYVSAWVLFLGFCGAAIRRSRTEAPERVAWGATGLAATAALWVVGLTHDVLFHNAVALAFCGMAGLVMALLLAPSEHVA